MYMYIYVYIAYVILLTYENLDIAYPIQYCIVAIILQCPTLIMIPLITVREMISDIYP